MSKNQVRGYMALTALFVVFSVIAFAVPFSKTGVFWLAYLFGAAAFAYQIYIFQIAFSKGRDVRSKFYGFPIAKVGVVYLIAQMFISFIEMAVAAFLPVWAAVTVNIIPIAAAVIGCVAADAMRDEIVRQDMQLKKDVSNMRELQSMSVALAGQCGAPDVKRLVQELADEFRYSDPVSADQTKELERELQNQMNEMQKAVIDGDQEAAKDLGSRILVGLRERNRICALSK